jgi:alkylation response protein AidB-like acyl-CoA dehydrogenase
VSRIEMINGSQDFCQEFLDDLRVPDSDRIGEVDGGWTVGTRWMFHERMLLSSPLVTVPAGIGNRGALTQSIVEVAREVGRIDDPDAHDIIGEARMLELVRENLQARIHEGMLTGKMSDQAAAVGRLFGGATGVRLYTLAFDLAGSSSAAWSDAEGLVRYCGEDFLMRQSGAIGGGTLEMARNVVSERVLGMQREQALDRDIPFRDVPRGGASRN